MIYVCFVLCLECESILSVHTQTILRWKFRRWGQSQSIFIEMRRWEAHFEFNEIVWWLATIAVAVWLPAFSTVTYRKYMPAATFSWLLLSACPCHYHYLSSFPPLPPPSSSSPPPEEVPVKDHHCAPSGPRWAWASIQYFLVAASSGWDDRCPRLAALRRRHHSPLHPIVLPPVAVVVPRARDCCLCGPLLFYLKLLYLYESIPAWVMRIIH